MPPLCLRLAAMASVVSEADWCGTCGGAEGRTFENRNVLELLRSWTKNPRVTNDLVGMRANDVV